MKLTKTTKRIILIALVAAVLITILCVGISMLRKQKKLTEHYVDYDACSHDLNMVVEFLQTKYPDQKDRPAYLRVTGNNGLLNPHSGKVPLPDAVSLHIQNIAEKGFVSEKTEWCMITFDGERIQFETVAGIYALVYSPEGKPTYLHQAEEGYAIRVEHIEGHWYHVTRAE